MRLLFHFLLSGYQTATPPSSNFSTHCVLKHQEKLIYLSGGGRLTLLFLHCKILLAAGSNPISAVKVRGGEQVGRGWPGQTDLDCMISSLTGQLDSAGALQYFHLKYRHHHNTTDQIRDVEYYTSHLTPHTWPLIWPLRGWRSSSCFLIIIM